MNAELLKNIIIAVTLVLVQTLLLNNIHLFGCATPLLYVYLLLVMRRNYQRWAVLVTAFVVGLSVDIFNNTPGMSAGSMTLTALLQPYALGFFCNKETPNNFKATLSSLGFMRYMYYSLMIVTVFVLTYFTLEMFSFFHWLYWLECVGGSTILTLIFIFVLELFRRSD